jgi:hypothetical protein
MRSVVEVPSGRRCGRALFLVLFFQVERGRINAEAKSRRLRAVFKDMSEMRVAAAAKHFRARHSMRRIALQLYIFRGDRLVVAWPSGT